MACHLLQPEGATAGSRHDWESASTDPPSPAEPVLIPSKIKCFFFIIKITTELKLKCNYSPCLFKKGNLLQVFSQKLSRAGNAIANDPIRKTAH